MLFCISFASARYIVKEYEVLDEFTFHRYLDIAIMKIAKIQLSSATCLYQNLNSTNLCQSLNVNDIYTLVYELQLHKILQHTDRQIFTKNGQIVFKTSQNMSIR